jgi:4-amino-4-deoxy-L-arabinose transferase-like glycosyltransferase
VRERLIRPLWLAAVVVAFCVPLFVGLGRTDMENDEAIYSYAVDGILRSGDWLNPPLSPGGWTFLEKPPLKFWIVAAPMAFGLLPHDEVGMRLWDALFGSMAFLYVFAIGRRLIGPVCGFIAVMVLFLYEPLLFKHGLRNHNMEAALVLCYCGGVYHYLAWAGGASDRARRRHILAVHAYFFLGFMTKFVAAFPLPVMLAAAVLCDREVWKTFRADLRVWLAGAIGMLLVAAPWFIYETQREGAGFWRVLVGEHVYQRLTSSLDPSHLQPWYFYFTTGFHVMDRSGTIWTVIAGLVVLAIHGLRTRRREALVVLIWFVVPIALISIGTSKLEHYIYPYLPPLALAAGYLTEWLLRVGRTYAVSAMTTVQQRVGGVSERNGLRYVLLGGAMLATVVGVATFLLGTLEWTVGETRLFRNSHVGRPLAVAALMSLVAGRGALAARLLWPVALMVAIVPVNGYENIWKRTLVEEHPLRSARECLTRVQHAERAAGRPGPGVYSIGQHRWFLHSYYYYLRDLGWEAVDEIQQPALDAAILEAGRQRPVMIDDRAFLSARSRYRDVNVAMLRFSTALLLLPGPYALCDQSAPAASR